MKIMLLFCCAGLILAGCDNSKSNQDLQLKLRSMANNTRSAADSAVSMAQQTAPVVGDAVNLAKPVIAKGVDAAKAYYPAAQQALATSSAAAKNADVSPQDVKKTIGNLASDATISGAKNAGPDINGNLDYGLSKQMTYGLDRK